MHNPDYLNNPMFWLRRASLAMRKAVDEELSTHGLTGAQFEVLRQLWHHDQLALRTLHERLGITGPTLTGILDGLVARGLVERKTSAEDARVRQVSLTTAGGSIYDDICSTIQRAHALLLTGFTPAEARLLTDWLQRIVANAGDLEEDCI